MKKYLFCLLVVCLPAFSFAADYLQDRIHPADKRYSTFKLCMELLEQRNAKILVETGTARCGLANCISDGCSTPIFGEWARDHGATLFSVDISPEAIQQAQLALIAINPNVQFATQDSVQFLAQFGQRIDFLYLDSYDFDFNNPHPSQFHHFREIQAVYPFLHPNTVIMIDDCGLPHGGKGKYVINFLLSKGWVVLASSYQTILIFPDH